MIDIPTPRSLLLGYLAKFHGMNLRELTPLVSESEAKWIAQLKAMRAESQPLAVQGEFPNWLAEKLHGFMEEREILELGRSMQEPAPLDLRVNTLLANREEVVALLKSDGIEGEATPYSPVGIRLSGKPGINRNELFTTGKSRRKNNFPGKGDFGRPGTGIHGPGFSFYGCHAKNVPSMGIYDMPAAPS